MGLTNTLKYGIWVCCILGFCSVPCLANLNAEMNAFFDRFGAQSNITSAEIYEGQKAGYLTGGGLTVRNRVMDLKPMTINLPKFDAGCGGIDLYAGGFSFINDQQLIDALKGIGSSAAGYAFLLGLETVSPQVSNAIKQLQTWANTINSQSINSCEAAANLVGAVWPRETQASQHICKTIGGKTGKFNSFLAARHGCAQYSENESFKKSISENKEYNKLLFDEYNIAWKVIQEIPYLANDQEMAELFMTLMGTGLLSIVNDKLACYTFYSKINDEMFLKRLLEGGELSVYSCGGNGDSKCLTLVEKKIQLSPESAWTGKIQKQLLSIQQKIFADEELSDLERGLLMKSTLPLYKIINVISAYKHGYCPIDLYQAADIIAMDLLTQFLKEAISLIRSGCLRLKMVQMNSTELDKYLSSLDRIEDSVKYYEIRTAKLMEQEFQLMQKIQLIEQEIASDIVFY